MSDGEWNSETTAVRKVRQISDLQGKVAKLELLLEQQTKRRRDDHGMQKYLKMAALVAPILMAIGMAPVLRLFGLVSRDELVAVETHINAKIDHMHAEFDRFAERSIPGFTSEAHRHDKGREE
jgi:hypothetical protein